MTNPGAQQPGPNPGAQQPGPKPGTPGSTPGTPGGTPGTPGTPGGNPGTPGTPGGNPGTPGTPGGNPGFPSGPPFVPNQPEPDLIVPVPDSKKIVTGTPRNIVPCEPTQADVALTISPKTPDAWLEVIGTRSSSDQATVFPNLGSSLSERLSKLNLVVPNVATLYAVTFMYTGEFVTFDLALTSRAQGLMLLHFWLKELTAETDLHPPTIDQVLAISENLGTIPSVAKALERFTSIPVPSTGNGQTFDPLGLLPRLDRAASLAANDLLLMTYNGEVDALRVLVERHLGQFVSAGPLTRAVEKLAQASRVLGPLRAQMLLLLPTRNEPASIAFLAGRSNPVAPVAR